MQDRSFDPGRRQKQQDGRQKETVFKDGRKDLSGYPDREALICGSDISVSGIRDPVSGDSHCSLQHEAGS